MSRISHDIAQALAPIGVELDEFGDLIITLMDKGVICRDDGGSEQEMYDRYVLCKSLVHDYLDVMGIGILHNEEFHSVRLFAPDAEYPGSLPRESTMSRVRFAIGADLSAALLVCFLLHKQHAAEGRQQEDYSVAVSRDEFYTAHATLLSYEPRPQKSAREEVLRALVRFKAVHFHTDFFENDELPLMIRPYIYDIVPESAVESVLGQFAQKETA